MNEARVANYMLIIMFFVMLAAYVIAVHCTSTVIPGDTVTTVSAFCG